MNVPVLDMMVNAIPMNAGAFCSVWLDMNGVPSRTAPYCLQCHGPLVERFDASTRCPACGAVNLRVDLETYWTRSTQAVASEDFLRQCGTMLILMGIGWLMLSDSTPSETGMKVFALMGTLIPIVLWWDLAGLRTRLRSRFRSEVLVPTMFLVMSTGPILWSIFLTLSRREGSLGEATWESLQLLLWLSPFVVGSRLFFRRVVGLRRRAQAEHSQRAGELAEDWIPTARRPHRVKAAVEAVRQVRSARGLLDARPSSSYRRLQRGRKDAYCLHCFAPIPSVTKAYSRCEECDGHTRRVDQLIYWSRCERHVRLERAVKALGLVLAVLGLLAVLDHAAELSQSFLFGGIFSAAIVVALWILWWDLAGLITRYRTMLRLELLLPVLVTSATFLGVHALRVVQVRGEHLSVQDYWGRWSEPESVGLSWSLVWLSMAVGLVVWWVMRWLLDWRESVVRACLGQGHSGD